MTEISIHALLAESDGAISQLQCALGNFYPRSPCGERRAYLQYLCELSLQNFYPRSPCGERRLFLLPFYTRQQFLSTLSLRRATEYWVGGYGTANNFYPRSPCGERLRRLHMADFDKIFLSTLSLRRATAPAPTQPPTTRISIHALLAESDNVACGDRHKLRDFYPRSPCGERPETVTITTVTHTISIHALLAESDPVLDALSSDASTFLSTLSLRRATP